MSFAQLFHVQFLHGCSTPRQFGLHTSSIIYLSGFRPNGQTFMGTHWFQYRALFSTATEAQNLRPMVTKPNKTCEEASKGYLSAAPLV